MRWVGIGAQSKAEQDEHLRQKFALQEEREKVRRSACKADRSKATHKHSTPRVQMFTAWGCGGQHHARFKRQLVVTPGSEEQAVPELCRREKGESHAMQHGV